MFSRRSSRQGSDASTASDGMDWAGVQDLVRSIQSRQTIPKDTLASTKKSLKLPSKSAVCSTLTTLDSIAANCGPPIRSQLAESRWMEMLLSVCCKNTTAALPICQLFSNWACSYNHEELGRSADAAIKHLRQRSAIMPPPAPLAHHMAEVAQQGTPMLGFQRGFDFTSVDLWSPAADSSGSLRSHQDYRSSGEQRAPPSGMSQVESPMTQKLQAMQQGVHTLRKVDQSCQYYLDVGQAVPEPEASQHMQRGWQLAKKCSSWANEVQVMIACEPSDSVLGALLQANDDLLAAVHSWDTTASRLVMLQSRSAVPAPAQSQQSASARAAATPEVSDSSSTSTSASDTTPSAVASGGVFWSHLEAVPNMQLPCSTSQQQAQQAQPQHQARVGPSSQQSYPSLLDTSPAQSQHGASTQLQYDSSQKQSSSRNHLEDLAGLQPQYPHQSLVPSHQQSRGDASWQGFRANGSMPAALPSNLMQSEAQSEAGSHADQVQEFHGSVLNYRLATPKHTERPEQESPFFHNCAAEGPLQGSQPWPEAAVEAQPSSSFGAVAGQQPFDPFTVAFDAFPASSHPMDPCAAAPHAAPESSLGQHSSGLPAHDSSFTSSASARGIEQPPPPQHFTGTDSALMSRKPSLSLSTGSRTPSLLAGQNLSTNSLSSLASGSGAAVTARSPSPASEYTGSRTNVSEAESEAFKLRRQIHQLETRHEEELRKLASDHDANVAAVQAQAVAKMKELIEKVKEQTLREREQAELRLQEAHQAEQNALAHLHSMRKDCRDKDALIAELQRKLSQSSSSPAAAQVQSHDLEAERPFNAGELSAGSQGLDLAGLQNSPFGGVPRPKSAAASQQLPSMAPSAKKGRMLRAGSHLDKGTAILNSLQAYYRQPALRVRFTPGQLEELSRGVTGPSHKEWAAALKLPGVQNTAE